MYKIGLLQVESYVDLILIILKVLLSWLTWLISIFNALQKAFSKKRTTIQTLSFPFNKHKKQEEKEQKARSTQPNRK